MWARDVLPPHPVRRFDLRDRLERLYRGGGLAPPITVIEHDGTAWAITGSHRVSALAKARPREPVINGPYFLVLRSGELLRRGYQQGDAELIRLLGLLFQGELGEEREGYHRLVDAVGDYLDDAALWVLDGQGNKR